MGHMRGYLSTGLLGVALSLAEGASSAPATDRLIAGEAAKEAATLVAGQHGARYELRGGAKVELSAGSEFAFDPSLHLKLRKPGDPETLARAIHLVHGRADVTVPTLRDPTAVMLRGPGKMSAVAKEGTLTFIADADRTTAAARVGEMLVGLGNDWKVLHPGFARTLAPEDPSALPRPILAAPKVGLNAKLVVVRGQDEASLTATWAPLSDAARYDVTLVKGGAAAPTQHQIVSTPTAAFSSLTPGAYSVIVAALDRQGLLGVAAEPCTMRVAGVQIPDGASVSADGAILIGRNQRVGLVGADSLEVSYGSSPLFLGAPSTLGLAHGAPTTVRFRAAGSMEEAVVRLEPQGLRAKVRIGPRAARWPLDHVAIEIELYDTSGRPVPEGAAIDASVTVNLTPAAVKWERSGQTLRATLPAGLPPGPWVVRAEVRSPSGAPPPSHDDEPRALALQKLEH